MATVQMDQSLADQMVENAIHYCSQRKFQGNHQQAVVALRQGRCDACHLLSDSLVSQVGEYLGRVDKTVKAVFRYAPEYPGAQNFTVSPSGTTKGGIHLIAWVDRKSAALSALGITLETGLAQSRRKIDCINSSPSCFNLDIQMVDDRDIQESRSFGLLANNTFVRSSTVWSRPSAIEGFSPRQLSPRTREVINTINACNPELAPETALFDQGFAIENAPSDERKELEPHLHEIKVALIHKLLSDQLAFINIARDWFTIADLQDIYRRRIGYGKIGGKAAGMLLARCILEKSVDEELLKGIAFPDSYFIGSDLIYIFCAMNGLMHWNNQKYKPEENIISEYPQILKDFQAGEFPPEIIEQLRSLLTHFGSKPLIVRSSSQLEDNFGTSFAGKYDSFFCPNQGTVDENLKALTNAITRTFASTLKPAALLYRRSKGLQDYDERMAILIQEVEGTRFGDYYFPLGAGVAFSRNLYRWTPQIQREAGFCRLVWGLGTRAVERVGNDFPRLVALSHPTLQPNDTPEAIRHYSQQFIDLIDLKENTQKTFPIHEILNPGYPHLRLVSQMDEEGFFHTPRSRVMRDQVSSLAITFDELLRRTQFAETLSKILQILEKQYRTPVDIEFTIGAPNLNSAQSSTVITLLQCRPQSILHNVSSAAYPMNLKPDNLIFSSHFMVPQGFRSDIRFVMFITPEGYFSLPTQAARNSLTRAISSMNSILAEKSFILVGPGRWGTTNPDLGVFVSYADIFRSAALVELAGKGIGPAPEPSLGTHFFQDLMEAEIFPVAIMLDEKSTIFNRDFFYNTPNKISQFIELDPSLDDCLRLIDINDFMPGHHINLMLDDDKSLATAYLEQDRETV